MNTNLSAEREYGPGWSYLRSGSELGDRQQSLSSRGMTEWDELNSLPNQALSSLNHHHHLRNNTTSPPAENRCTLWWGDLEPWMEEEYAKQVCTLMGWDPVNIRVPRPPPDPVTGQQANNPGFCFLTFPTPAHAASVLAQVSSQPIAMPNSTKPFILNWASAIPPAAVSHNSLPSANPYPKEYSIFVGDLAPETSNSDLVAVFRNPVLGLRNDREPKFIRPFLSCKSAKIMLDPVTGVSRGYGFVRFTDEADQQRALIEMHGLYCLSRPMRISPATAKFKPPPSHDVQFDQPVTVALPLPSSSQPSVKSVSTPIASSTSASSSNSSLNPVSSTSSSSSSLASTSSNNTSVEGGGPDLMNLPPNVLAQIAQSYASGDSSSKPTICTPSITSLFAEKQQQDSAAIAARYGINEESWKHHAHARAILGNLIGPNGEQLTSTDPYNTTVFVGGLSPLISEETLRTFFAPFGDIHYVKVPVGKHCGFVQFVRKADAERAIEKMQGFPVGGSRIRLSWGRSQYKAAQAAAQAAQAAALQSQPYVQPPVASQASTQFPALNSLSQEQVIHLLSKFAVGQQSLDGNIATPSYNAGGSYLNGHGLSANSPTANLYSEDKIRTALLSSREDVDNSNSSYAPRHISSFSPFSPDPNVYDGKFTRRDSVVTTASMDVLPHSSKAYTPGFYSEKDEKTASTRLSPTSRGPTRLTNFLGAPASTPSPSNGSGGTSSSPPALQVNRAPAPISRPPSGQPIIVSKERSGDEMCDLNGTLASLNLVDPRESQTWTGNGGLKSPSESTDSTASVQFRLSASP